jgi:hypothetical protein
VPPGPENAKIGDVVQMQADGLLKEPFWRLDQPVARVSHGKPSVKAVCGAAWSDSHFYVAVAVEDAQIHEKAGDFWEGDRVEVFLDTENSRETEYNANHKRVVITPSGKTHFVGVLPKQCRAGAARTPTGYVVELDFSLEAAHRKKDNYVYGFDVAVNDDADGGGRDGQLTWRGTAENGKDPRAWGTVICAPRSAP